MVTRRQALSTFGLASTAALLPKIGFSGSVEKKTEFRFCLNTSTISGQKLSIPQYIEIAAKAGYNGIELWVGDVKEYLKSGQTVTSLKKCLDDHRLKFENAIGFAPWLTDGDAGFKEMKEDMELLASIGCARIAASPAGVSEDKPLDLFKAGERYRQLIELGRQTGVMPQLEFWGGSKVFWHIGQAFMIAAVANDPDARILADVFHLYTGNSGFESLNMTNGHLLEVFHMNDFDASIPKEKQTDEFRIYPGDGGAPMNQILTNLKNSGGNKVLSIELFNKQYWKENPLVVAQTGIQKMKKLVNAIE